MNDLRYLTITNYGPIDYVTDKQHRLRSKHLQAPLTTSYMSR